MNTIIDGITYKIEKVDGSYVATKSETEYKAPSVFDVLETHVDCETMYENLSYDKEADLYIAQIFDESNNEEILKFKLKDGKITEACYASMDSVGSIIEKYEFTDFGITVVELPEFTFAE